MKKLIINGASDDLVEVGGDFHEEFNPSSDEDFLILVSDGTVLKGSYNGTWRFVQHTKGTATFNKVEAPEDDDDNYSDVVTIEGDIAWVALGSQIAKPNA